MDTFSMHDSTQSPSYRSTEKCELFLIMPATSNIMGKIANGICDDLISTAAMASNSPVVFVPSMNQNMWFSKANQRNTKLLKELGHYIIPPSEGYSVAGMKSSFGIIPQFDTLVDFIKKIISSN